MKQFVAGMALTMMSSVGWSAVIALECTPTTVMVLDTDSYTYSDSESCPKYGSRKPNSFHCEKYTIEFSVDDSSASIDKPFFLEKSLQFTGRDSYEYKFERIGNNSEPLRSDVTLKIDRISLEYSWFQVLQRVVNNESVSTNSWNDLGSCRIVESKRQDRRI